MPETGGSNVPALNLLLAPYGIAFSDHVYDGDFTLGAHDMYYASGSNLARFPEGENSILIKQTLTNQAVEILTGKKEPPVHDVAILGLHQVFLRILLQNMYFQRSLQIHLNLFLSV